MKITIPQRADAPNTNLYVDIITISGSKLGDRAVIFLIPGVPGGNHTVFYEIQDELLRYGDLVLFDPRGCGQSDASAAKYCSLNSYIDDIQAIRERLCLGKIILLGGSYGAMAALGYAVKYNEYLEKLILLGGAPSYRFLETAKVNLKNRGSLEQKIAAKSLFDGTFKDDEHFKKYYQITSSLYLFKKEAQQNASPTTRSNVPYNIEITNFGFSDFLRKFNFENELKNISCNTLILAGKNDWINDPKHSRFMAKHIQKSQLVIFDDCGHFIWADQREKFFQALNNFLIPSRE
ncbi:MAG: alpha/beta fold hydrolase [Gammaproteobacteria bacterium]